MIVMNVGVGQWCILLVQSCVQSPGKVDISVRDVAVGVGRRKQRGIYHLCHSVSSPISNQSF